MNKKTFITIVTFILVIILFHYIHLLGMGNTLDFNWNYNNSLQIANGLLPYRDISIITTPLLHFTCALFMLIFGQKIIVYSIFLSIMKGIFILLMIGTARALSEKIKCDNKSLISIITFIVGVVLFVFRYYEYNYLAVSFLLLIIIVELRNKESIKKELLIGLFAALSILSKQSIGAIVALFTIIKPLIFDKRDKYKKILYRAIGLTIPLFIFLIYLLLTNTLGDFISYCILGLKEFNNNVSLLYAIKEADIIVNIFFISSIIFVIVSILYLLYLLLIKKKQINKTYLMVFFYSLSTLICIYPICDSHHFYPVVCAFTPLIICPIAFNKGENKRLIKYLNIIVFVSVAVVLTRLVLYYNDIKTNNVTDKFVYLDSNYGNLEGMIIRKSTKESIDKIIELELEEEKNGTEVIIMSKNSVMYHIVRNKYIKDFDLFMKGNFGNNGEKKLIDYIKTNKNKIYLIGKVDITKDDSNEINYYQIPTKVIDYTINNLSCNEEIDLYIICKYIE